MTAVTIISGISQKKNSFHSSDIASKSPPNSSNTYSSPKTPPPGDVVLIAGKGHETYQEIQGVKYHFDDKEVLVRLFRQEEEVLSR